MSMLIFKPPWPPEKERWWHRRFSDQREAIDRQLLMIHHSTSNRRTKNSSISFNLWLKSSKQLVGNIREPRREIGNMCSLGTHRNTKRGNISKISFTRRMKLFCTAWITSSTKDVINWDWLRAIENVCMDGSRRAGLSFWCETYRPKMLYRVCWLRV